MKTIIRLSLLVLLFLIFKNPFLQAQTITTGTINASPFCAGTSVNIPFTSTGTFNAGNVYTAQLSNSSGSFGSPVTIGSISSTSNSGNIAAIIPGGTTIGSAYRIRIVSSNPVVTGSDNGVNISVNSAIAGTISALRDTICSGTPASLAVNGSSGTVQWQFSATGTNFSNIAGASEISYFDFPSQTTFYRVAVGNGNCADTSSAYKIVVITSPVAQFTSSSNGLQVTFNSAGSSGDVTAYNWDFGDATQSSLPNPVHTYAQATIYHICLTVFNGSNCSFTLCKDITVSGTSPLTVTSSKTSANCGNADGSISLTVIGGTAPYTYSWSNGSTKKNLNNIVAGIYSVTVKDNAGTSKFLTTSVSSIQGPIINWSQENETTSAANDGSIVLTLSGGQSPYTINWSNGNSGSSINNLSGGFYSVTVSDAHNCFAYQSFFIAPGNKRLYVFVNGKDANCGANGVVTAVAYDGTPPYSYLWNTFPSSTAQSMENVSGGSYSVTVTDGHGNTATGNHLITSSCFNIIQGKIFYDGNSNCIFDGNDFPMTNTIVAATKGGKTYYGSTYGGQYEINVPEAGTYQLTSSIFYNGSCTSITLYANSANSVTFNSVGDTSINNFGLTTTSAYELSLFISTNQANPGFQKEYSIYYKNQANINFSGNATITFKYDSNLVYQSSLPPLPVHDLNTHTLTWQVDSINSDYWKNKLTCNFLIPSSLSTNYRLQSDFKILPTTEDCDSSNNFIHTSELVRGSFDPNEKEVLPVGDLTKENEKLTYTIHFQNTGSDTTHFIIVRDTLSPYVEPLSVETISSSHPYEQFRLEGEGALTWVFNPLFLPEPEPYSRLYW